MGSVFVSPPERGRGVATALSSRIELLAREHAVPRLHLQTERLDGGLYTRLGFEPHAKIRDRGDDVLVMTKDLPPL